MAAILEKPELYRTVFPLPVAAYERLGDLGMLPRKTELVRGIIFRKPEKSPLFCFLENAFAQVLRPAIGHDFMVRAGQPLLLADSCPEPDLAVVAESPDCYQRQHPATARLIIEIAISSEPLDREKAAIYAEAGVEEYWIVLPDRITIERFHQPDAGRYAEHQIFKGGEPATCRTFPGFELNLVDLLSGH